MKDIEELVKNLYSRDEYITKHPSLGVEDSLWKVGKIIPLVDKFIDHINKDEINLLDVGGGAGLILNTVSTYIENNYRIKVSKHALDLSPEILEIQKGRNPDLRKALNEDIRKTSLDNKEIDLTLLIDVLEHVPNPTQALAEVSRISHFVIFKVPLEDNLCSRTWNFIKRGEPRKHAIETFGHINAYYFSKLKHQIEKHTGRLVDFYFTNQSQYYRTSEHYAEKIGLKRRLIYFIASHMFRLSPRLCAKIFNDFVIILVECY